MKGFLRSRLILTLAALVLLASAIAIPLSSSITHSHAASPTPFSSTFTMASCSNPSAIVTIIPSLSKGDMVSGTASLTSGDSGENTQGEDLVLTETNGPFTETITINNSPQPVSFTAAANNDSLTGCIKDGIDGPDSDQTATISGTITPAPTPTPTPPPTHQKLFVLLQGINSSLSDKEAAKNNNMGMVDAFWESLRVGPRGAFKIPAIVPFLQAHGFGSAQFLVYSYKDSMSNGNPVPYDCLNTFTSPISGTNPIAAYAMRLGKQINAELTHNPALMGHPTDVFLIAHSLGGVVALSYLTALYKTTGVVPSLPTGDTLKGVITLDSPIGGVSTDPTYFNFAAFVFMLKCGSLSKKSQLVSVKNLQDIFTTTSKPTFPKNDDGNPGSQGAHASILKAIFGGPAETNQGVAEEAFAKGTSVLTIGNTIDFLWKPAECVGVIGVPPVPQVNFLGTQWIGDEGPADAAGEHNSPLNVYGRKFTAGDLPCFLLTTGLIHGANHFFVLNNMDVESALAQFLPNGGTPSALAIAPPEP